MTPPAKSSVGGAPTPNRPAPRHPIRPRNTGRSALDDHCVLPPPGRPTPVYPGQHHLTGAPHSCLSRARVDTLPASPLSIAPTPPTQLSTNRQEQFFPGPLGTKTRFGQKVQLTRSHSGPSRIPKRASTPARMCAANFMTSDVVAPPRLVTASACRVDNATVPSPQSRP